MSRTQGVNFTKGIGGSVQHDKSLRIVDVRSREEFEAVHIEGSTLLSQDP